MLPFRLLFRQICFVSSLRDIVSVNAKRWEVRVRDHRRCDVNNTVVAIVRFPLLGEVTEIIDERVKQPIIFLRNDSVSRC